MKHNLRIIKWFFFYSLFVLTGNNQILYSACTEGALINSAAASTGTLPSSVAYSPITSSNLLFAGVTNSGNIGSDSGSVSLYTVNTTTGSFSTYGASVAFGTNPGSIAYSPIDPYNNIYMAMANFSSSDIYLYTMDASGNYSSSHLTLSLANNLESVAFSPFISNKVFLATTEFNSNTVVLYALTPTSSGGLPSASSPSSSATGGNPNSVVFSPVTNSNQLFVSVAGYTGNNIYLYEVNQSSNTLSTPYIESLSGRISSVAFSPIMSDGTLFLAATDATNNTIHVYTVNSNLTLAEVSGSPFSSSIGAYQVAFTPIAPDGNLFAGLVADTTSGNNISMFQVNTSTGAFTHIADYSGNFSYGLAFSPLTSSGKLFAAVANALAPNVATYTVQLNPAITITPSGSVGICAGTTGLALQASVTSGTGNYTSYVWTQGATQVGTGLSYTITNPTHSSAGTYTLTVTDSNGCIGSQSVDVSVTYIQSITASPASTVCAGTNVELDAQVAGGSGNYSYSWTGPNGYTYTGNPAIIDDISTSDDGTYNLTVTDNGFSCSTASTISITVDPNPVVTISSNPVTACYGGSAILTANVSGGSGSYSYAWTLNGSSVGTDSSTLTVNDIIPGTNDGSYQVTVTDTTTTCNATSSSFTIPIDQVSVTLSSSSTVICQGASITLTADITSGAPTYSYEWYQNGSLLSTTSDNTYTINNLSAGTYTYQVIVTDSNPCQGTSNSVSITVNSNPTVTITPNPASVCLGSDITLTATASGGSGTYDSYSWTTPTGTSATNPLVISNVTSADAGTYTVTVTDSNTCSGTSSSVTLTVNPNPVVTITPDPASVCLGGDITLTATVSGGSGGYTYSWTTPTGTVTGNPLVISNASSADAGSYTVTVTDSNICSGTSSSVTLTVNNNPTVTITPNSASVCVGSNLTLTATALGGSGTYSNYAWTFNGSSVGTNSPILQISSATSADAGTYAVTVTDSNGCSGTSSSVILTVNPNPVVTITPNPALVCLGSDIMLIAHPTEGSGNYTTYVWTFNGMPIGTNSSTLTIDDATNDNTGTYQVTVTDSNGCQASSTTTLIVDTVNVNVSPSVTTICSGGNLTLTATVTSGVAPYTYQWVGPNGYTTTGNPVTRSNLSSLDAGTYTVIVTDFNLCTGMATAQVIVDTVNVTVLPDPDSVCLGSTITLTANVSGGTVPYSYSWTGPNDFISNFNPVIIPNATFGDAGTYTVTVTDFNGCTGSDSSIVSVDFLTVNVLPDPDSVCLGSTITLTANVQGGAGNYSYNWTGPNGFTSASNPVIIPNATLSDAGTYTVTVTDFNGCTGSDSSIVSVGSLTVNVLPDPDPVCPGSTITLTANAQGGTTPYSYSWTGPNGFTSASNPVVISNASSSNAGTYQVTVTDFNGCTGTDSSEVTIDNVNVTITPNPDRVCLGSTVILTANVSGIAPYTYQWTGPNGYTFTGNPAVITNMTSSKEGTYTVTVTDAVGCKGQATDQVILDQVGVSVVPSSLSVCSGSTINLSANVTSGIAPYTYQWIGPNGFSSTDQSISITNANEANAGTYQVIVTDSNGCRGTASAQVGLQSTQVMIVPDPAVVSPGSSITLRAEIICGQGTFTYQWTGPNGFTSSNQIITISNANGYNAGTYTLTVTDVNGNKVTSEVDVIVDDLSVDIISDTLNIRQGQTIVLTAEPKGGQSPYTYQWFGPAVTRSTSGQLISTDQILIVNDATTANSGIYTVVVTDAYGFTASDSVNVTVRTTSSLSNAISAKYCS